MIERIKGTLESVSDGSAAVTPIGSGLTYRVMLPAYLVSSMLSQRGREVELFTLQQLDSPNQGATFVPRLIGFGSAQEREFFELFTTVKGVGTRKALRAMSEDPASIAGAIARRDAAWLTALPEIGKRTAETIVAELDGKVGALLDAEALDAAIMEPKRAGMSDEANQAISALTTLGESPIDAERMVRRAIDGQPGLASTDEILEAAYRSRA